MRIAVEDVRVADRNDNWVSRKLKKTDVGGRAERFKNFAG